MGAKLWETPWRVWTWASCWDHSGTTSDKTFSVCRETERWRCHQGLERNTLIWLCPSYSSDDEGEPEDDEDEDEDEEEDEEDVDEEELEEEEEEEEAEENSNSIKVSEMMTLHKPWVW